MIEPETGALLIADPFLKDPHFMRTVVFLCEHRSEGSFGFVLNKRLDITLGQIVPELETCKLPVFYGGPVQNDTLHFLHSYPNLLNGSIEVTDNVYWGGDFETLTDMIRNGSIDITKIRFYLGYSGWGEGQLASEMETHSWLTVKARKNIVFMPEPENIWPEALRAMGGEYAQLINYPIDPQLN
ncbi:MAG: YqgE/AlgH family protein [Dinghuibacter sp.]|nr:YqgE/AlgH family protein [Dinghuibacter sp.]